MEEHSDEGLALVVVAGQDDDELITKWKPVTGFTGVFADSARAAVGITVEILPGWVEVAGADDEHAALAAIVHAIGDSEWRLRDCIDDDLLRAVVLGAMSEAA